MTPPSILLLAFVVCSRLTISSSFRPPFHFDYHPTFGVDNQTELGGFSGEFVAPNYYVPPLYPGSRTASCTASLNSRVWMFGGYYSGYRGDLWSYNVTVSTWSFAVPHMTASRFGGSLGSPTYPGARGHHSLVAYESNRLRLVGGYGFPVGSGIRFSLQDVWDYAVDAEVWSFRSIADGSESFQDVVQNTATEPFYPSGRFGFCSWPYFEDLFIFGGHRGHDSVMWRFNDSSTSWSFYQNDPSDVPNYEESQQDLYCWSDTREPHRFYLFGGGATNSNRVYSYSVPDNEWTEAVPTLNETLPGGRKRGAAVFVDSSEFLNPLILDSFALMIGGEGYVEIGGLKGLLGSVWRIDPLFADSQQQSSLFVFVPITNSGIDNVLGQSRSVDDGFFGCRADLQVAKVGRNVMIYSGSVSGSQPAADVWVMRIPCRYGWVGEFCDEFLCFGQLPSRDGDVVCSGYGTCVDVDECACDDGYNGTQCEQWSCFGVDKDSDESCNEHLDGTMWECVQPDVCSCVAGYTGPSCQFAICFDVPANSSLACGGGPSHGSCVAVNTCHCMSEYVGENCDVPVCYGMTNYDTPAACGLGTCVAPDTCNCPVGFVGSSCEFAVCHGIPSNETNACQSGACVFPDQCDCRGTGYLGSECQDPVCGNLSSCGPHGTCIAPEICLCEQGYEGDGCHIKVVRVVDSLSLAIGISVPIGITLCFVVMSSWICFNYWKKRKRFQAFAKLSDADILLADRNASLFDAEALDDALFDMDFEEIELIRVLDVGGSGATVYVGQWHSEPVAVKMFNLAQQRIIPESLERELDILLKTHHPNVLTYIGTAYRHPRVALVTEFCEKGDLKKYLTSLPSPPSLLVRIQMLSDIVSAMTFLHQKRIIHRDIKPSNVLVANDGACKLTDFGLSRVFHHAEEASKTGAIGTCAYMAPEMVTGEDYSDKIDVFSFGILIFVIVSLQFEPYGGVSRVEYRVATDPVFRPPVGAMGSSPELGSIAQRCWSHDPMTRPSFREISEMLEKLPS